MATKTQLQWLLQQDQEPFHLHVYIAERRTKLKSSSSNNQLQLARIAKPVPDRPTSSNGESSVIHFPVTFCKNACFNAETGSPEVLNRASPVFSLTKSPVKLLKIPSKTAALLLEAALRIHKHSSRKRTNRFGTDFSSFGSVLKKLSVKTHKRNSIDAAKHQTTSLRSSGSGKARTDTNLSGSDMEFSINERRSDAVWSDNKSLDTETSCSSSNSTRTAGEHTQSPSRCLSPSPSLCTVKDVEEEKEQCSPVCVLDPPFEQAGDDHNHHHHNDDEGYGCECSYTIVERTNQQLLRHNLSRFEALADFNFKDLEKLILEDEHELYEESVNVALETSSSQIQRCIDMKRLVSDLIDEEDHQMEDEILDCRNEDHVVNEVCGRLSLWNNGVQQINTIDMMIEEDLREKWCKWKMMNKEELRLVAMDVEVVIFETLINSLL